MDLATNLVSEITSHPYELNILSDPYIEISVLPPGYPAPIKIFRSSVQKSTLTPTWEPFALSMGDVGGLDGPITISCYDWESDGSNPLIGSLTTTCREFTFGPVQLPLINSSKSSRYAVTFLNTLPY